MRTLSSIPGGLAGPPSACSSDPNRIDVFAVGSDANVWRWAWDGTNWAAPVPLPAFGRIPSEGVCAVSSAPGRVEVFAAEAGTSSPVWWRGDNGRWLPAALLLPVGANLPAVPVAAVCTTPDDIDVFAAGAENAAWWWHWNGSAWTPPTRLPGGGLPAERIAAVSAAPGRLDVFAPGAGNHLWHWAKVGAAPWSVSDLGGNLPAEGVSAVSWGPNRIDVFAASHEPGNPLQHWWWDGGGFALESLGGSLAAGTVSAVSHAAGRLDVFGVSTDRKIAHWQWDGQQWTGPTLRGDELPAGDVSAVVRVRPSFRPGLPVSRSLDVFVAGAGNTLRKWPGGGLENAVSQPWSNWPTNREKNPVPGHLWPDSLEELVNIVQEAERRGQGVRAVGSSWSNSDVAVSSGYVVETSRLNGILTDVLSSSLNTAGAGLRSRLVHVEAGIKLYELNEYLDARNLALPTMGGSSGQSLAGVVSTSAHGMDVDRGPIPDMVRAIHLVGPGGVQHWIEPSAGITTAAAVASVLNLAPENVHHDDDWFKSVLVSMGSMGVIYSCIIEAVDQYDLVSTTEALDWSAMKDKLKGLAGPDPFSNNHRGVQVAINPYPRGDGSRACYLTTRAQDAPTVKYIPHDDGWLAGFVPALVQEMRVNSDTIDDIVTELTKTRQPVGTTRGWGHSIMGGANPGGPRGLSVEVVFDATPPNTGYLDFLDSALQILKGAYYDETPRRGYLGWISLRFQKRSRAYLSPQHGFDRPCTIEFAALWRAPQPWPQPWIPWPETQVLLERLEGEARRFGGIQHWGMNDGLNAIDVGRAYPRLDTWRRVRWELTKGGTVPTFDNDFTRRCGLSDAPLMIAAADYDNDGRSDFAVWRPSTGTWFVIDSSTGAQRSQPCGSAGDIPVPGRYGKGAKTDFAVWRPTDGTWQVLDSSTGKTRIQQLGQTGDIPVPGDYDGDGRTDFAVWRPSTGTWFVIDSSTGNTRAVQWGQAGDIPVPGRYDAAMRTDFAVWRPSIGTWFVLGSATGDTRSQQWGAAADIPV